MCFSFNSVAGNNNRNPFQWPSCNQLMKEKGPDSTYNMTDCIDKGENEGTGIQELMEKAVLEGVVMPGDGQLCAVQGLRVSAGDEISTDSEQTNKEEKEEKVLGKRSRRLKIRPRLFAENDGTRSLMMEYATEPPPFLMDNPFEANEIIPGLYLGDYSSASKKQDLKQRGITHVLNCARSARKWFPQVERFKVYTVPSSIAIH